MFSSEAAVQSARSSLRNPRRRQRDSDGLQQQARRKRSKLSDESSVPTADVYVNGNGSALMNGHAGHGSAESSGVLVDIPVREKSAVPKRTAKEVDTNYLTRNATYSVKRMSGFPAALRRPGTPFRASVLSSASLALAFTSDHALLWDYNSASSAAKSNSLPLPPSIISSDPLPLGAIVRNGPTNDYGVVAVAPSAGKVVFWENVDNAEARNLYPQRNQLVEGSVKLYSSETVIDIIDVEHAGFILNLSSGRLAHLSLRDPQGRPSIGTTFLSPPNNSNGSFFSLKGLLGGGIRKGYVAVKAYPAVIKGQMRILAATRSGLLQEWNLTWSGQQHFSREFDVHDKVCAAVQTDSGPETRTLPDIQVLDFCLMEQQSKEDSINVLALVAVFGQNSLDYSIVEIDLSDAGSTITRSIPVRLFVQAQLKQEPTGKLILPHPGHTAYVIFPGAVFITSLAEPEESPEAQLLADTGRTSLPYQDTIYFREDKNVIFSGYASVDEARKDRRSDALVFLQQYGMLKISAQPPTDNDEDVERLKVTARSKLEQATLFSSVADNVLDFTIHGRFSFSEEDTAQAAIDISSNIISSSYGHLEKVTSSMEEHLKTRAALLKSLIVNLQTEYTPLSFDTKWRLLTHAEKLGAALMLWRWYQEKLKDQQARPEAYPEPILMDDIVRALHERYKTPLQVERGETDRIRQFFLKDIDTLNILIPWAWSYLRTFYMKEGQKERPSIMQRLSEGTDAMLVTIESAFAFRQANIDFYDLDSASLDDGILKPGHGYDKLPNFWTSSHNIVNAIRSLVDVGRNMAVENYEQGIEEALAEKIGKDNPRLVKLGCQTFIERFRWALEQSEEKTRNMGRKLREEWNVNVRPPHILGLMEIGLATEGMNLAEHYEDMPTLVNLIWEETSWLESEKANTRNKMEQAESTVKLNRIRERISRYFETYGDQWAEAFYAKYFKEEQAALLFERDYYNLTALSKWLRAEPERARVRWIHEASGERYYEGAANALYEAATALETNAWCQRVQLSIAKLATMCRKDLVRGSPIPHTAEELGRMSHFEKVRNIRPTLIRRQLAYTKIQEAVYERLEPIIVGALDDDSAVELLMVEFGQGRLKDRPALQSLLKEGFECIIHHKVIDPALMVDVLTLMGAEDREDEEITSVVQTNEFSLAFQVLHLNWVDIHPTTRDSLCRLIWKRLCLKDDWATINNTKNVSDADLEDFLAHTAVGWTMQNLAKYADKEKGAVRLFPKDLAAYHGAGATHGELCVRFSAEDLRTPMIRDNVLDDGTMRELVDKHRLDEWFLAAIKAGKRAHEMEKAEAQSKAEVPGDGDGDGDGNEKEYGEERGEGEEAGDAQAVQESVEVEGGEGPADTAFEGDTESVAEAGDATMVDS